MPIFYKLDTSITNDDIMNFINELEAKREAKNARQRKYRAEKKRKAQYINNVELQLY